MNTLRSIQNFIEGPCSNTWINYPNGMKVYVRKGHHMIGDTVESTFDVANISVPENLQKGGLFTYWLKTAEAEASERDLIVFVESVLNPHLAEFLTKRGYIKTGDDMCPSFYRKGDIKP